MRPYPCTGTLRWLLAYLAWGCVLAALVLIPVLHTR